MQLKISGSNFVVYHGGLNAPGSGARPHAGLGEAPASQVRLSARLAGGGGGAVNNLYSPGTVLSMCLEL